MNIKITATAVKKHNPCPGWTLKRLKEALGKGKTLLEVLGAKNVSAANKIWCVTRFLPNDVNRAFAIWCARMCKNIVKEVKDYIDTIENFYAGKATERELYAARIAAHKAGNKKGQGLLHRAAYIAACEATSVSVLMAAYFSAYWMAGQDSGYEAEVRKKQIRKLREIIKKGAR